MTIGPEPMTRTRWRSVRSGMDSGQWTVVSGQRISGLARSPRRAYARGVSVETKRANR